jgi:hypothetical protein
LEEDSKVQFRLLLILFSPVSASVFRLPTSPTYLIGKEGATGKCGDDTDSITQDSGFAFRVYACDITPPIDFHSSEHITRNSRAYKGVA